MTNKFESKVALITGAANGIGASLSLQLASQGANLVLVDKDAKALEELDDQIQSLGQKATLVPIDLKQLDKIDSLILGVAEKYQKLDILIGNAAILGELGPITDIDPNLWQDVIDINLNANWRLLRGFNALLKKSLSGRAIFLTSMVAQKVTPYWSAYSVSKAGLEMMVKLYRKENEIAHPNLRIELFDPGSVSTNLRKMAMPGEDNTLLETPENVAKKILTLAV